MYFPEMRYFDTCSAKCILPIYLKCDARKMGFQLVVVGSYKIQKY